MYMSLVFGDEFLAQGLHLNHTRGVQMAFCLSYTQMHGHVRIEKGPLQTVAIKLEVHKSLKYHYML